MSMTRKEMNLRVFRGAPLPHVFFQPRFEPWFDWHRQFDSLPPQLGGMSLREVYDLIGASMRTVHYYTGQPDPIETTFSSEVKITEEQSEELLRRRFDTPYGPLFEVHRFTIDRTWRRVEFLAKKAEDLVALRWLLARRIIRFNAQKFGVGAEYIGDRGVPQFWVPKSPYLALAQQLMRYEDFVYALADQRQVIEEIMAVIDASYDRLYEQLTGSIVDPRQGNVDPRQGTAPNGEPLQILNFGENIAMAYLSRRYFERYLLPWYEKRCGQLHEAGIFTHIHIDGYFGALLPYLADLPFDGLEALTPKPQGDVTLEEIKEHIGDKVLLDGIPAVLFLEHYSRETFQACVEKVVALFHPRLVLGISDELPEAGGGESFERMRWVAEWCREHP